jgi:2-dehydropantoate 2-reductase
MKPYKTSMLLDFEAGKPMEVEAILGNAVRAARRTGVPVPHLESLYALLQLVDRKSSKE